MESYYDNGVGKGILLRNHATGDFLTSNHSSVALKPGEDEDGYEIGPEAI